MRWLKALGLRIDRSGELPVGLQLTWGLRAAVRLGRLEAGARLPAARELADALGVNVNTVRAVLTRLAREGLVEVRHGSGAFVVDRPPRDQTLAEVIATVNAVALGAGFEPGDVAAILTTGVAGRSPAPEPDDERVALRAQIGHLDALLGDLGRAPAAGAARRPGPRILSADDLRGVRDGLIRRLAEGIGPVPDAGEPQTDRLPVPASEPKRRRVRRARPATAT